MKTLTTPTQFTAPADIPAPKFQLFQQVSLIPRATPKRLEAKPRSGVIVGMEYITLFTALVNSWRSYGWEYKVDFYFEAPFADALTCTDPVQSFDEKDLVEASQ